ncbi:transglycosylase domain-containing protein [Streptomyces sp. NPDC055722]
MGYMRPGGARSAGSRPSAIAAGATAARALQFVGVSALAGIVVAGIALPAAGALGLSAKGAATGFDHLPGELKRPPLSQASHILDANSNVIATVYSRDRTVVPLGLISPVMQKAIVAIEDARFWQHGPIDPRGILRAVVKDTQAGGAAQGASTLTQQYVKNVFVEEAGDDPTAVAKATSPTLGRKVQELKYAIQAEKDLGKKKILENYLNIVPFGEQSFGIEAASERYFSTHAKDLTLPQAALLAGVVNGTTLYDPIQHAHAARDRRDLVLQRMADVHAITQAQADAGRKQPLGLKVTAPHNGCVTAVRGAGFFCDYVREVFLNTPVFGKTAEERARRWNTGGLTIKTTLDPQVQDAVRASIAQHVYKTDPVATAVTLVQPGTGKILAMGQSRPYGFGPNETQINYNVDHNMGGGTGFQSGSTFKPIVAAAAIDGGTDPNTVLPAPYSMNYPSPVNTCGNPWLRNPTDPPMSNENKSEVGPMNMQKAMALSVNTYFVQLIGNVGICPVVQTEQKLGVHQANGAPLEQVPSITLGTQQMTPLTMASAYAAFADNGVYCTPTAIESINDSSGKSIPVPQTTCNQAVSPNTAATINTLLKGVVEDGTGRQAGLTDRDSAGKTGTTDNRYAAWFVGYTSNLAGAVWVGGPSRNVSMTNITIGGVFHAEVFGADTPGPIWRDAMAGALAGSVSPPLPTVQLAPDKPQAPGPGASASPSSNVAATPDSNG